MGYMRRPPAAQRYRAAFAQRELVDELEALIDRANPPLSTLAIDGWRLRTARGFTQTANSVWPHATRGRLSLSARLRQVERFYATHRLPPRFQVSPSAEPADLDRVLAAAGYTATPAIEVRTARIDRLVDLEPAGAVSVIAEQEPRWLAAWVRLAGQPPAMMDMATTLLRRVRADQAFAVLEHADDVAIARGVSYGGWLGVDYLVAAPAWRSPTTGHALLGALGRWAAAGGAERAYCCVDTADESMRLLVDGSGWRRAYHYRFRVHPLPAVGARS